MSEDKLDSPELENDSTEQIGFDDTLKVYLRSPVEGDSGRISNSDESLKPGDIVGASYEVIELLDRGGMGQIYRVRHVILQKIYAMKTLSSNQVSETAWRRLQVEAQAIARISHPNIVGIHNFGLDHSRKPYYVMDLLDGQNLASLIRQRGSLETEEVIAIFLEICEGLGFAHRKGIVHRDIKPSNIIILNDRGQDGAKVKLVDFGIAKLSEIADPSNQNLTNAGEVFGTPFYMSPEQCLGQPVDSRSDIYSLGCTLFEALTGQPPFKGESPMATAFKHQEERPPTLQSVSAGKVFPSALEAVVANMLAKEPMHRYQSLSKVAQELAKLENGTTAGALSKAKAYREVDQAKDIQQEHTSDTSSQRSTFGKQTTKTMWLAIIIGLILFVGTIALSLYLGKSVSDIDSLLPNESDRAVTAASLVKSNAGRSSGVQGREKFSRNLPDGKTVAFDFPTNESIGIISTSQNLIPLQEARGTLVFSLSDNLYFVPNESTIAKPQILSGFSSNDLFSLGVPIGTVGADFRKAMPYISKFKELRVLEVEGSNVSDDQIKYIDQLTKLDHLNVNYSDITGKGLSKLKVLRNLSQLYVNGNTDVTPLLRAIAGSKRLSHLGLESIETKITEEDIKNIARCRNLFYLDLMLTGVTDQMLDQLHDLPRLKAIDLTGCPVTNRALARLKMAYKGRVRVRREY